MAIRFTKYVDITSGVGAGAAVKLRELIGRLFTSNVLVPTNTQIEFDTLAEVGDYFGTTSTEYKRAAFYFGWVSKLITRANKLSFARWNEVAVAPRIFGGVHSQLIGTWAAVSDGAFNLTIGSTTNLISGLDFTGETTLAGVATVIQTEIQAQTGTMWTAASVTYDATRGSFNFTGGQAVAAAISVSAPPSGTNILSDTYLGWTVDSAIFSDGALGATALATVTTSAGANNNFGSFAFIDALSIEEITDIAEWNSAQNVLFIYCVPVLLADVSAYYDALKDYAGAAVTEVLAVDEYPEMVPMLILAATDYDRVNSVQNYMFQQFALSPTVTTDSKSDLLDSKRANYYGRTQTAGQQIDFYQRGLLMGQSTAPVDMNVYANEMWLKDAAGAAIMTLLLSLARVSANAQGRSQILTVLQDVIDRALNNGTISVGKTLTTVQKLFIDAITNDPLAWHQVQGIGYWVDCVIESEVVNDVTEYKAVYNLIYAKDDAIRKVEGTHTLI